MDVSPGDPKGLLQLPANRRAGQPVDYDLLVSALQYSLQNSILINSTEDIKCLGEIAVEPYLHQVENLKQFLNNYPHRMMLLDEVGLGKTISAGLILAELMRRRRINNFLVVCPAILVDQWEQELREKFRFSDLRAGTWQRIRPWIMQDTETLRIITTYNAIVNHQDVFLKRKWDFVIADEGDYLKTLYSARGLEPSARARVFYDLLKEGKADFFLLLTATPLRKNLWDVFNLAEITTQPGVNPIGTPQSFRTAFIADDPTIARRITESHRGEFRRRLTEIAVRNSRREQKTLMFPKRHVEHFAVPLSDAKRGLLELTLDFLRQRYNLLRKVELKQIEELVANWHREIDRRLPHSWDLLKVVSDEVANHLGDYEFKTESHSDETYTTSLSYEFVIQAFLGFVERVRPEVAGFRQSERIHRFLSQDLLPLVGQFFANEIRKRRPNKLEEISLLQSVLSSPAAGARAFRQKRSKGALTRYEQDLLGNLIERAEAIHEPEKAKQLLHLAQRLREERPQDYRLLVFTIRQATQEFLGEYLEANGFKDQVCLIRGGCPRENLRSQRDFQGVSLEPGFGPPKKHILISTDAGSAGINLQACNTMVNYDLPWVAMTIEQRIGRIQRLGQIANRVIVNNFHIAKTIDENIVLRLWQRIRLFELAIGELEAILKESDGEESRDLEEQIFELIMLSKEQRDEEVARRLERMNRDEAIQQLHAEQAQNEELLGELLSTKGTPRFTPSPPAPPRLDVRTFCRGAMERLGHRTDYHSEKDLLYVEFKKPTELVGRWERYTFSEPDASEEEHGEEGIRLLAEGTKEFEEILRRMRDRGGIVFRSCEPLERFSDEECLEILGASHGDELHAERLMSQHGSPCVAWRLTWKVTTAVARDRFERLVGKFFPGEDPAAVRRLETLPADRLEALPLEVDSLAGLKSPDKGVLANRLRAWVQTDEEIRGFEEHYDGIRKERIVQLKGWFNDRRREEGIFPDPQLQQERARRMEEVEKQFVPSVQADLVVIEGFVYRTVKGEVECAVDRNGRRQRVSVGYNWTPLLRQGQLNLECRECGEPIPDRFEVCAEGHMVCATHLARCGHPGCPQQTCRRCTSSHFTRCRVSGVYACAEHLRTCPSCGEDVLVDLLFQTADTDEPVCPDCFEICEATGTPHLLSELERSDLTGKFVHHRLLATCPVTGKRGLAEEMEREVGTEILHAPEALGTCAVSGARVTLVRLSRSEISGKACLPQYLERCVVSGLLGLPDELGVCAETGQPVDRRLLVPCSVCGSMALATALRASPVSGRLFQARCGVTCEVSGDLCLPEEIAASAVSGRQVRCDRLVASDWSKRLALAEETMRCEVSGELLLVPEAVRCEETGQMLSPRLIGACAVTGKRVHKMELATCDITRQQVLRRLLERSSVSGKHGLRERMERDDVDGSYALPGELEPCAVTGKRVTPDKLVRSALSKRTALVEAMATCPESNLQVCPDELLACQATGIRAVPKCFGIDEVSGRRVLQRLLVTCAVTGKQVLPEYTKECVLSGQTALTTECEQCAQTGQWVLRGKLEPSAISGMRVLPQLLRTSAVSGKRALPEEMTRCQETGEFALSEELEGCQISKKRVLPRLLTTCPDTGQRFLEAFGKRCAKTEVLVHPEALGPSDASGLIVRRSLLAKSAVSDRVALEEELRTCAESRQRVLPDELARCAVSDLEVLPKLLSPCAVCSRPSITSRQVSCRGCFGRYCPTCVLDGLCRTCRSIQPALHPPESLNALLRAAVLQTFPTVGRVSMARNNRWVLVFAKPRTTRFWEGSRLLVFEEKGGSYVLYRANKEFSIQ